jgi:hypothetical protein
LNEKSLNRFHPVSDRALTVFVPYPVPFSDDPIGRKNTVYGTRTVRDFPVPFSPLDVIVVECGRGADDVMRRRGEVVGDTSATGSRRTTGRAGGVDGTEGGGVRATLEEKVSKIRT